MARKESLLNLHQILKMRRDALRRALAGDLSLLKEMREQTSGDVIDFALDSAQDEINSQLAEVESRELGLIDKALEQFRNGEYGKCESCSGNIPLARLQALPYATLCINCQRESEKHGFTKDTSEDWSRVADSPSERDLKLSDIEADAS